MPKEGLARGEIRTAIRSKLSKKHDNETELSNNSINLAAGLLLMCNFGITPLSFSGRTELSWTQGTLRAFLANYFGEPPILSHEEVKLEKRFQRKFLCHFCKQMRYFCCVCVIFCCLALKVQYHGQTPTKVTKEPIVASS